MNGTELEIKDLELLEEEIRSKLSAIVSGVPGFSTRILRAGLFRKYPLRIHEIDMPNRFPGYRMGADRLAHLLTIQQHEIHPDTFRSIRDIVLVPRIIRSEEHLLTHIFCPGRKILARYIHPLRLDEALPEAVPERFRELPAPSSPGLFHSVTRTLDEIGRSLDGPMVGSGCPERLHKFVIPLDYIERAELREMDEAESEVIRNWRHEFIL